MTKNLGVTKAYCSRARIRGTLGDIDPRDKVTFQRAGSRVKKGPFQGSPKYYLGCYYFSLHTVLRFSTLH